MIRDNIAGILKQIEKICKRLGRDSSEITLVGVTKFADASQVNEAIAAGLTDIGENKVQEAKVKFRSIDVKVTKHMIGHLQTNKVKEAVRIFDLIQSVDSIKLATAIEAHAARSNKQMNVLIQVNTAGEEQKFGIKPSEVFTLIDAILKFKHLFLRGLMTMAPLDGEEAIIRQCFQDCRHLSDQIKEQYSGEDGIKMDTLSMGMTDDFEIALEEGSNMVRIGRAIFGE